MKLKFTLYLFFVMLSCSAQQWNWALQTTGINRPQVDQDSIGNIYTAVQMSSDTFQLAKLDSLGNTIWNNQYQGKLTSLSVGSNYYFVGGYFNNTISIDTFILTASSSSNGFLAKYDFSGNLIWARSIADSGSTLIGIIRANASDHVFVLGSSNAGRFVSEYDVNGIQQQIFHLQGIYSTSFTIDKSDNIYLLGSYYDSTLTFADTVIINQDTYYGSFFFAKLHKDGQTYWARDAGSLYRRHYSNPAINDNGEIYLSSGQVYSGNYLTKMNSNGQTIWHIPVASVTYPGVTDIKIDTYQNVFLTGGGWSTAEFGNCTMSGGGDFIFLAKMDFLGNCIYALKGQPTTPSSGLTLCTKKYPLLIGSVWYNQPIQLGSISVYGPNFIAKVSENVGAGVNELSDWELNFIYPNPSQGIFTIQANNPITKLSVTNLLGQVIYQKTIKALTTTLDLTSQSKGIYFIELIAGEARAVKKIIIE